jgi:hypothetical protein
MTGKAKSEKAAPMSKPRSKKNIPTPTTDHKAKFDQLLDDAILGVRPKQ